MEEKIFKFINDQDFHSMDETCEDSISVLTLNTFFKTLFGHEIHNREALEEYFKLK